MRSALLTVILAASGCASPASDRSGRDEARTPEAPTSTPPTATLLPGADAVAFVSTLYHAMSNVASDRSGSICGCVYVSEGRTFVELSTHVGPTALEESGRKSDPTRVECVRIVTRSKGEVAAIRRLFNSGSFSAASGFYGRSRHEFEGIVPGEEIVGLRVPWDGDSILLPIEVRR
jgi:hypothetical protein